MADTSRYDYTDATNKQILVTILEAGGEITDSSGHVREVLMAMMEKRGFTVPQHFTGYLSRMERGGWLTLNKQDSQRLLYSVKLNRKSTVERITRHLRIEGVVEPAPERVEEIATHIPPELIDTEPEPTRSVVVVQERAAGSAADIADALLAKLVAKLSEPNHKADTALQARITEQETLLRLRQTTIDGMKRRIEEMATENKILRNNALAFQERGGKLETEIAALLAPEQRDALAGLMKKGSN